MNKAIATLEFKKDCKANACGGFILYLFAAIELLLMPFLLLSGLVTALHVFVLKFLISTSRNRWIFLMQSTSYTLLQVGIIMTTTRFAKGFLIIHTIPWVLACAIALFGLYQPNPQSPKWWHLALGYALCAVVLGLLYRNLQGIN